MSIMFSITDFSHLSRKNNIRSSQLLKYDDLLHFCFVFLSFHDCWSGKKKQFEDINLVLREDLTAIFHYFIYI